jgi:hypothetical protein
MIFDWRLGMACWLLAAFLGGLALNSGDRGVATAVFAAGCFAIAGAIPFYFDPVTARDVLGHDNAAVGD